MKKTILFVFDRLFPVLFFIYVWRPMLQCRTWMFPMIHLISVLLNVVNVK